MRMSWEDRFHSKIGPPAPSGCWPWLGTHNTLGYGQFFINGGQPRIQAAHRVAWRFAHGPIPEGMHVCHTCDVRNCVNPAHLFLGTHTDNMQDKIAKGRDHNQRKTHCPQGHPYSGPNLYITTKGKRTCRTCANRRRKKNHDRVRDLAHSTARTR